MGVLEFILKWWGIIFLALYMLALVQGWLPYLHWVAKTTIPVGIILVWSLFLFFYSKQTKEMNITEAEILFKEKIAKDMTGDINATSESINIEMREIGFVKDNFFGSKGNKIIRAIGEMDNKLYLGMIDPFKRGLDAVMYKGLDMVIVNPKTIKPLTAEKEEEQRIKWVTPRGKVRSIRYKPSSLEDVEPKEPEREEEKKD